ncbi:hypothetical protein PLICRDRAFT_150878 [Plicaturopsis crispa FD-325 SS-3]|nr:hypothetical protein PLICRDRAFT_150878 [Plicaturopsis crispa FD-325 SS-3]
MDSRELIDIQFDRAVEIVQGLPKTGPIQTGYEEKLTILYKQATVGNVKSPRPGIWDMLGRAKWDAWAKHKDLDQYEARWLYVDALLKVLAKYSDKTVARDLIQELESYGGDPGNLVSSHTASHRVGSDSSGSTASEERARLARFSSGALPLPRHLQPPPDVAHGTSDESTSDDDSDDEGREHPTNLEQSHYTRPQSSLSSHRYRTPMAGSLAMSPPPHLPPNVHVPAQQPRSGFETPSAFADPNPPSGPSSFIPSSYTGQYAQSSRDLTSPSYPIHPQYRSSSQSQPSRPYLPVRPASRPSLEHAIENVQAHLAALTERIETLESASGHHSHVSLPAVGSPKGRGSPTERNARLVWDLDDLGMWSFFLNPVSRALASARRLAAFFARDERRSPGLIVIRRLCLDISFLFCVLAVARALWKKTGMRRREVNAALAMLWRALVGTKKGRELVDRGV